ncbi:type I DNA topoisomerase, partial [candidate division TA06 bacterium]|nr:type I DNA topoisomerase [candidate division TA06 bacterium]
MGKSIIIVESPTKARTLGRFLGKGFTILSSVGHIKDLPKSKLGVDIQNGFTPHYITIRGKGKILKQLKTAARNADQIFIATDPDREGEAIAQHIAEVVGGEGQTKAGRTPKIQRILVHEITKEGILEALKNPGKIDRQKVESQQARRVLDRLVGYEVSPVLWKTIRRGLSAGRVQSVALRILCERDEEIEKFSEEEYWSILAQLKPENREEEFEAKLVKINGEKTERIQEEEAKKIEEELTRITFQVKKFNRKERKTSPYPPFITSTLQQEASRRLRLSTAQTMRIAQQLYEGVEVGGEGGVGLITYMRTDSVRISQKALEAVRDYIQKNFEPPYLPPKPMSYKSRKTAQEAHEAIRPTDLRRTPEKMKSFLRPEQEKLYRLIWERFLASQMSPALFDTAQAEITAGTQYEFDAKATSPRFDGFMKVYPIKVKEEDEGFQKSLPDLSAGETLTLEGLSTKQHFTKPPPRYTEATLVRELESKGIGRPSTYAPTLSTILGRGYVERKERLLIPTELGMMVNRILIPHFPDLFAIEFSAQMEDKLDKVESGELKWVEVLQEFYPPFEMKLKAFREKSSSLKESFQEKTDIQCEKCGNPMVIKLGRYGKFLACSNYPECKNTRPLETEGAEQSGEICEKCGKEMVLKQGRYGRFLSCSNYPECDFTKP